MIEMEYDEMYSFATQQIVNLQTGEYILTRILWFCLAFAFEVSLDVEDGIETANKCVYKRTLHNIDSQNLRS